MLRQLSPLLLLLPLFQIGVIRVVYFIGFYSRKLLDFRIVFFFFFFLVDDDRLAVLFFLLLDERMNVERIGLVAIVVETPF